MIRAAALIAALGVGHAQPAPWWDVFTRISGPRAPERAAQVWAESGFRADATSYRVGSDGSRRPLAHGPAQFIPATWARYGRPGASPYDVVPALEAQHRFMLDLERLLGDWPAALAGYNAGPGNILRARRRAAFLGLEGRDAWRLTLPQVTGSHAAETLAYVPKIERKAAEIRRRSL